MTNYIEDINPFKLAGPPQWFLRLLWDFDASLVIVPSRQTCVYRLAQRRKLNLPSHIVNDALFKESDTKMLATYGLIPVTSIMATATWSPFMIQELHNRAPHRQGGAEAVNRRIETQDAIEDARIAALNDSITTHYAKEGWKSYRKRIGLGSTIFS